MIRCETCLVALQIADREDNNCPTCKDYSREDYSINISIDVEIEGNFLTLNYNSSILEDKTLNMIFKDIDKALKNRKGMKNRYE
jgi:hypothetical protein